MGSTGAWRRAVDEVGAAGRAPDGGSDGRPKSRRTRLRRTRSAVIALTATALLCLSLAPVHGQVRPADGENENLRDPERAVRGRDIPGLAVNPADPSHVVEVEEEFYEGDCDHHVTFDGGETWARGTLTGPEGFPTPLCPQFDRGGYSHSNGAVAFGRGLDVYTAFTAARPGEGDSILVAKSVDGGRTFAPAEVVIEGAPDENISGTFRPKIAASGDRVTVVARSCDALLVPGAVAVCYYLQTTSTTDGGETWTDPVQLQATTDTTAASSNHFSQPAFTPDGLIHIVYTRPSAGPRANLILATSADDGRTWSYSDIAVVPGLTEPKLVAGPDGALYLAYQTTAFDSATDIGFQRRPAGSEAWSEAVRVNDDPVEEAAIQRLPDLSLAPGGRIDVLWHDRRHVYPFTGARMEDYYLASSFDGGETFATNRRVTDRSINLDVGLDRRVTGGFYWPALVPLGDDRIMAAWGDSREGNFHTDTEDVYTAVLPVPGTDPVVRTFDAGGDLGGALARLVYPGGLEAVAPTGSNVPQPASHVVVVNETDPAGAAAAAALARFGFGPLLTSPAGGLTEAAEAEVRRVEAIGAFVIGDETRLSSTVVDDLVAAGVDEDTIVRLAGEDDAGTAALIAERLDTRSDADRSAGASAFPAVIIANPATADGIRAAALSASLRLPFLFVSTDTVPAATSAALDELAIDTTLVIGGPASVSDAVLAELPDPTRLGGDDAASTSEAVVAESVARGVPVNVAYVGDSERPVEAALLAAAVARLGGLFVLTTGADVDAAAIVLGAAGIQGRVDRVVVVGGAASAVTGPAVTGPVAAPGGRIPATGGSSDTAAAGLALLLAAGLVRWLLHGRTISEGCRR